jgi:hypothetical protein
MLHFITLHLSVIGLLHATKAKTETQTGPPQENDSTRKVYERKYNNRLQSTDKYICRYS